MTSAIATHLFAAFAHQAQTRSGHIALTAKQSRGYVDISYGELYARAVRLGKWLEAKGLKRGDKVALLLENQPEFASTFFGLMYAGLTAIPLDTQYSIEQIRQVMEHSGAKLLLLSEETRGRIPIIYHASTFVSVNDPAGIAEMSKYSVEDKFADPATIGDLAVIFYTSGTTSTPKGVMLTHRNLLANFEALQTLNIVSGEDNVISILPLHHAYSFTVTLLTPLFTGARIVYPASLNSGDLIACLREQKITIFVGVPQVFSLIHRGVEAKMKDLPAARRLLAQLGGAGLLSLRRISGINVSRFLFKEVHKSFGGHLRYLVSGGAKLDPDVANGFLRWGFTILEGYGLTETSPVASFNRPTRYKIGSVGQPLQGVEIRTQNVDEQGVGEVLIKGPNVMAGYYELPQQTADVIRDGWFHTGDLGYLDADGFLFLVGRKKEVIVLSNGKNIYPEEVEKYYAQNPFVKELAVLPEKVSGYVRGVEHLVAVIVINEEQFRLANESNIRGRLKWELENLSAKLPTYQRITGFAISKDPLPRTRLGKIMRYKLPELYKRLSENTGPLAEANQKSGEQLSGFVQNALDYLKETFGRPVQLSDHLELDLGLDSLSRVELLLNLQERLGLEMTEEEAAEFFLSNTVGDLLTKLKRQLKGPEADEVRSENEFRWDKVLAEDPSEQTKSRIQLRFGPIAIFFNLVLITLFKILFKLLFILRHEGRHNLPKSGPYLICPNHVSYLDGLFVLCALPYRVVLQTYFVGYSAFFESPILSRFIKVARLIPLEISLNLLEALRACAYVLKNGKSVCYFPEGQRSIDAEVKEFKKGVGILIKELDLQVVPVYLEGAHKTWPRTYKFPHLAPVKVIFGKPVKLSAGVQPALGEDAYEAIASRLREAVLTLSPNK